MQWLGGGVLVTWYRVMVTCGVTGACGGEVWYSTV